MSEVVGRMLMRLLFLLGPAGGYARRAFRDFNFKGIPLVLPDSTFEDKLTLQLEEKKVELIEVKDTHKAGNILVFLPDDKVLFAADLLLIGAFPMAWTGPLSHWIESLEMILRLDAKVIVHGHGPIITPEGVKELRDYFIYIRTESEARFRQGLSLSQAAQDIDLEAYTTWSDTERVVTCIECVYRELDPTRKMLSPVKLFGLMARLQKKFQTRGR